MCEFINQTLGANVTVETEARSGRAACVMADANQLELGILNLGINARDAMPDGGTLTISTAAIRTTRERFSFASADTGTGMPPEVVARAFDPFFTTKPPGKGTGLGLSQVYGIVRQIGGDVDIISKPGEGTTVRLHIRRGHVAPAVGCAKRRTRQRPGNRNGSWSWMTITMFAPS